MQLFRCHHLFIQCIKYLFFCRGPQYGYKGKVVLPFEENESSKIGVRFEKAIPDGNDLGGHCEEDRGFFCSGDFLKLYILYVITFHYCCCIHVYGRKLYAFVLILGLLYS